MVVCDKRRVCWISSVTLGVINLIAFGVLSWVVVPMFYSDDVVQQLRFLYGETGAGEHWRKFKIPSYRWLSPTLLQVYLFNVTNPTDMVRNGMKPILKEVGPYVYTVDKSAESRSTDNITTEFRERTFYHFSPSLTPPGLLESDLVTVVNVPYLEIIGQMTSVPSQNRLLTSLLASGTDEGSKVFVTKPVRQILFDGFHQSSTGAINKLLGSTSAKQSAEISYIYPRNGSLSPPYKVYSATPATTSAPTPVGVKFGDIQEYDNEQEMQYWADSYGGKCNKISGNVDGMMFEPVARTEGVVQVFHPEICRTLKFVMNGNQEQTESPVKGYEFGLSPDQLYESTVNFANNCYCPREGVSLPGGCIQPGVLSNCHEGFPFVTTLPHFFGAEQLPMASSVIGLEPRAVSHQSVISVEPITGLATKSVTRLQTNYHLKPSTSPEDAQRLPNIIMPILWTAETKEMNAVFRSIIEENIYTNLFYLSIGIYISLALGISLLVFGLCLYCVREHLCSPPSRQASRAADKEASKRSNGQTAEDVAGGDKASGVPLLTLNGKNSEVKIVSASELAAQSTSSGRGTVL